MDDSSVSGPVWQIAVYAAVEGCIPGEPFVAYPLIPDGKRGVRAISRFSGASPEEARAAAQAWIDQTVADYRRRAENAKARADKLRSAKRAGKAGAA